MKFVAFSRVITTGVNVSSRLMVIAGIGVGQFSVHGSPGALEVGGIPQGSINSM